MAKGNAVLVDLRRYSEHQPIAGACLKGWALADPLLRDRVDIVLLNPMREIDTDDLVRQIMASRPRLIGFSCYVWNIQKVLEVARTLKDADPELAVLLGGPEVSPCAEEFIRGNDYVDYVALGEGEETFRSLLRKIFYGEALESVPGLAYRDSRGVVRTPIAEQIDLSATESPYLNGLIERIPSYTPVPTRAIMETSRGCPFTCKFCEWGPRNMRYMPLERIESELRFLAARYSTIEFGDADLLMHKRRGADIIKIFLKASAGKNCRLFFNTNPVFLTPELVDLMAQDASKFGLFAGVQTTNQKALERIARKTDFGKVRANIDYLRRKAPGVYLVTPLIYGLPADDLAGFHRSLEWIMRVRPDWLTLYHALVLPGSDFNREAAELGLIYQRESPHRVIMTSTMSEEDMRAATELAFYMEVFWALPVLVDTVIPRSVPDDVSLVRYFQKWLEFIREKGIDLSFGLPVSEVDGVDPQEKGMEAKGQIWGDSMLIAELIVLSRRFVEEVPLEAVCAGASLA